LGISGEGEWGSGLWWLGGWLGSVEGEGGEDIAWGHRLEDGQKVACLSLHGGTNEKKSLEKKKGSDRSGCLM